MRECPVTLLWLIEYGWKIVDFKKYSVLGWEDEEMLRSLFTFDAKCVIGFQIPDVNVYETEWNWN